MPIVSTHPGLVNSELPTTSQLPAPRRRRKSFLITSIVLSYLPLPSPAISYACDFHDGTDWRSRCPEAPAAAFAIAPSSFSFSSRVRSACGFAPRPASHLLPRCVPGTLQLATRCYLAPAAFFGVSCLRCARAAEGEQMRGLHFQNSVLRVLPSSPYERQTYSTVAACVLRLPDLAFSRTRLLLLLIVLRAEHSARMKTSSSAMRGCAGLVRAACIAVQVREDRSDRETRSG